MVRSSKRSGHSPFKAVMLGSSPARITILGYRQEVKAPVFDTGTAGSNPAIPAMIRYSRGSRGQSAKLLVAGSNPARISIWCLRLIGQDTSLSSWQYGFESRRHHQRRVAADNSGTVAQLVERQTEKLSVTGSIPVGSTIWVSRLAAMAADCKSAGFILRWFESNLAHQLRS